MRVLESLSEIDAETFSGGTAVAIGKFDGVHLGHRALLARIAEIAEAQNLEPIVFTFANHPLSLLRPEDCPAAIMSKAQRVEALSAEGAAACVFVPFDEAFAAMPAEQFVERVLIELLQARVLCVGTDFRFGHRGAGDPALLQRMGEELGFTVEVVGSVEDEALGKISSSRVREAILQGDVATAARMMGRAPALRGVVVRGDARGRELGFPTANLGGELEGLRPADGVYAGWAVVDGARHKAAISVGANITFNPEGEPRVEAYLIDFDGDLYGASIELRFVERLRGMAAFADVQTLVARMREDVRETRGILVV